MPGPVPPYQNVIAIATRKEGTERIREIKGYQNQFYSKCDRDREHGQSITENVAFKDARRCNRVGTKRSDVNGRFHGKL